MTKEFDPRNEFGLKVIRLPLILAVILALGIRLNTDGTDCEGRAKINDKFGVCETEEGIQIITKHGEKNMGQFIVCELDRVHLKENYVSINSEPDWIVFEIRVFDDLTTQNMTVSGYPDTAGHHFVNC